MRDLIDIVRPLVESADLDALKTLAQKHDDVDAFIRATDGLDVLYRGHHDDATGDNSFLTDYVGHAAQYGEDGTIDAFAYDPNDVFYFDDNRFDEMRFALRRLDDEDLVEVYRKALEGNRFAEHFDFNTVKDVIEGDTPYSEISGVPEINDALVPLLQSYARQKGKNIIAFHGNDYADYGGQIEFVVGEIARLTDLRKLHAGVRQPLAEEAIKVETHAKRFILQKNPSPDVVVHMMKRSPHRELRGFLHGGDVYIWDADDALHAYVAKFVLGISETDYMRGLGDRFYVHLRDNQPVLEVEHDSIAKFIENPHVRRILSRETVLIYDWYNVPATLDEITQQAA